MLCSKFHNTAKSRFEVHIFELSKCLSSNFSTCSYKTSNRENTNKVQALELIYNSLGGPNWTNSDNWLSGDPCNTSALWYGIDCYRTVLEPGNDYVAYVQQINLPSNNLVGTLPTNISALANHLNYLFLQQNQISGTIPEVLYTFPLNQTILSYNLLTGSFFFFLFPHLSYHI